MVRREVASAIEDVGAKLDRAQPGFAMLAVAGGLGYAAMLAMLDALVDMLATIFPRWFAALLVGGAFGAGAVGLGRRGIETLNQAGLGPQQVSEAVNDTREAVSRPIA